LWLFTYKMSSCTASRDLPSNVWWLYRWETELSPLPSDFLHVKFLLVRSQGKGDNSVCHLYSHQTLLGKSLDAVQEDILYIKSHKVTYKMSSCTASRDLPSNVWWLYRWETELSPLPSDFLHVKFLLVLHLETCKAMSDDCISDKLNCLPYLVTFTDKISSCTTSRDLPCNVFVTDTVIRHCLAIF
jgi:hypothetical protein